jgi:hypothetical protein
MYECEDSDPYNGYLPSFGWAVLPQCAVEGRSPQMVASGAVRKMSQFRTEEIEEDKQTRKQKPLYRFRRLLAVLLFNILRRFYSLLVRHICKLETNGFLLAVSNLQH